MGPEVGRRKVLAVATLGAAATVVGGVGTWQAFVAPRLDATSAQGAATGLATDEALREPPVVAGSGGALAVDLTAAPGAILAGRRTGALGYNGTSPGPTLRVAPGDVLRVRLTNHLGETTNLHTHGLHVSPNGNADNVFRMVEDGAHADYEYPIPPDHPAGTFWYHPHHHGLVAQQVFGGLFGAIVVAPAEAATVRERVLVVSDTTLTSDGQVAQVSRQEVMAGREGELVLVNGQLAPVLEMTAGTPERWRVVNACVSRFVDLALGGHTIGLLGHDGQSLADPEERASVVLAPGNRVDLLVSPDAVGSFPLRTLGYDRGGMGMMGGGSGASAPTGLATVRVAASSSVSASAPRVPGGLGASRPAADLRDLALDGHRTITFTMGMGSGMGMGDGMTFGFDGQQFSAERVDQRAALGTVEEWALVNTSPMAHPFHLHVWPMQVVAAADLPTSGRPDWRDVVIVPAHGQVTVRVRFADFAGRTVYHCHVLDHEDLGMMGVIAAR
jgi:FtsP/CotA-like multicopper oxidase with cupredoxin domain